MSFTPALIPATREAWLLSAVEALRPLFTSQGHTLPSVQVSIGFTSRGMRSHAIGQCWPTYMAADKLNHIFIVPALSDSVEILDVLVHELVHVVDDCQNGHGKAFKRIALSIGLEGKMRSAHAGTALKAQLSELALKLGHLPHAALAKRPHVRTIFQRPRARCNECGYEVPILKKFLAYGPPLCPRHKTAMEAIGDWTMD